MTDYSSECPLTARAIPGLPEITPGVDLAALIVTAASNAKIAIPAQSVMVIAQKAISKTEGRVVWLDDVIVSDEAEALADRTGKDPRLVQCILDESNELLLVEGALIVCETHHGWICANAGIDLSNTAVDTAVLLPLDPDASARVLRRRFGELIGHEPAVVITDSFGRPFRQGLTDVAIGAAGVETIDCRIGMYDANGRELRATAIAVVDQIAAAADLTRMKHTRQPVVIITGLEHYWRHEDGACATTLQRPAALDHFRRATRT